MRRDFRKKVNYLDSKVITFSIIGVVLLAVVVFGILMYGKNVDDNVRNSQLSTEQIASITESEENTESTSTNMGKSIEEVEEENKTLPESDNTISTNNNANLENSKENKTKNTIANSNSTKFTENKTNETITQTTAKAAEKEERKELNFQKPIEGEEIRQFAKDNLIYSQTLAEWVTHLGIDIKAEKTAVVQAAEEGIVKSIKNDPRYGLTIVISHQDGFETVYANLLSSEFVKEGDKVTKGQAIGTVGNTAVFESADDPHLHFEILKDSTQVDPNIYLK